MTRFFEVRVEFEDGGDLVLDHFAERNAGPRGDNFADDLLIDANMHEWVFALDFFQFGFEGPGELRAWA